MQSNPVSSSDLTHVINSKAVNLVLYFEYIQLALKFDIFECSQASPWSAIFIPLYRPERNASKIKCPVLFIAGTKDALAPSTRIAEVSKRVPNAELMQEDAGKICIATFSNDSTT